MSKRLRERLMNGEAWVRWTFSQDEWERYYQSEWRLSRAALLKLMLYFGGAGLGSGVLLTFAGADFATAGAIGLGGALLFGGLMPGLALLAAYRTFRGGLKAEPVVYMGSEGAVLGGRFVRLGTFWVRSVTLVPGSPAVLRFVLHGKASFGEPPSVRLPVPAGMEAEAAAVRDRFRALIKEL